MNIHTLIIILSNLLVSLRGFKDDSFFNALKFNIAAIQGGDYKRLLSSSFLHVDWKHFGFNMFTLYVFADIIIFQLGTINFYLIYIISLIAGNLLSYVIHKKEPYYSAVGASGAVTGIVYAAILLFPEMALYLFFVPIPIPAYVVGVAYMLFSLYGMKKRLGNIGHDAHFGGAIGGSVMTLIIAPWILNQHLWVVLLLAIPIALLFLLNWKS
ncbi:MAG: rhomboid family intramembrane serine protease [Flavobacteriaceae bacterium]